MWATFPWFNNEEREKNFIVNKEPIVMECDVFFHLKNTEFDFEELSDV